MDALATASRKRGRGRGRPKGRRRRLGAHRTSVRGGQDAAKGWRIKNSTGIKIEGGDNCGTDEYVVDDEVSTEETISRIATVTADRQRASVVGDRAEAGPTAKYATRMFKVNCDGVSERTAVTAFGVGKHDTKRYSKIIRFL